jgi:outer membrane murein-binding lipoprotein Lpp
MIIPEPHPHEPVHLEAAKPEPPHTLEAGPGVVLVPANAPALENDMIDVRLSQLGDTPMIHEWKMFGLQTILAGALVAATTGVAPAEAPKGSTDEKKDDVAEQLKALQGQVKALNETVGALNGALAKDFKRIDESISRLGNDVLASKDKAEKASTGVENLRSEVDRLRKELEALRTQVASGRTSNYPQAQASTGRVRLVNTFTTPVTILVNNKAYEVMPGETRVTDALPAGTINYEVLGIQAARNTRLDPNETLTINVYTRQ